MLHHILTNYAALPDFRMKMKKEVLKMALKHINPPYTLMGAKMELTDEQKKNCKVLYKHLGDGLYEFAGLYNPDIPDEDYPDDIVVLPIRSIFNSVQMLRANTRIWNVVGSTNDHRPVEYDSWIDMWEEKVNEAGYGDVARECYVRERDRATCNGNIIGGHVVVDQKLLIPPRSADGVVYLVPICRRHNKSSESMVLCKDVPAILFDRYLERNSIF